MTVFPFRLLSLFGCLLLLSACDAPPQLHPATWLQQLETTLARLRQAVRQPPPPAPAAPVIRIGRLICGGHLSLAVVEKRFQDRLEGFRLQTVQNHDWNDVVADMKSGRLAGSFMLSPLAMQLIHEGFPGRIVLVANRNGNGFVLAKKLHGIDALRRGRHLIAVPHVYSQHHVLLQRLLRRHAIPREQVVVLGMPPRDMINALRRGEIDGFVVGEPEGNKSVTLGVGWMAAISPQIWPDHMDHVLMVSDRFIREQPKKLQSLVDQLVAAAAFIEAHPHEAAVIGEDYTGSSAAVFEKVLTSPPDWIRYTDLVPTSADMKAMAAELVAMGLWPAAPSNLDDYFDARFVERARCHLHGCPDDGL